MDDRICANCGAANSATQKFCGECGSPLTATCANGHVNAPDQKFCGECGLRLGDPVPAPTVTPATAEPGERRLVSVLFADLVGFTTFSESRDPEDVRAMLTRYFERAREVVERFGGEVDKFIGDAITVFWGASRAHEDDAERAVRAALELVDAVAALGEEMRIPGLAVRAGVLSGETSVGSGGNEKGLVVGDIVNTASRLQSVAEPGTVYVGDSTRALTEAAVRYAPVGEREMKGKSSPVTAWRAVEVVSERGGRGRGDMLEPPFVGREDEFRLLKDQLHATTRDGTARLVSIIGEAGIGKSRLTWELQKYIDGVTEVFRWHQGRSPAYGDGVTFWALAEMVRARAGIAETDEPMRARTRLRTAVAQFVPEPEEQQWMEPWLAGLLGLADMPAGDRNELFAALRTFFQRIAATGTAVLLFEDLHWADDGQVDFIDELVDMSQRHPILVITLARPDMLERHPSWGTARPNFLATHLGPLADRAVRDLVVGMVPGLEGSVVEVVVDRAGGVPLYAVEYIRMLVNDGHLVREGQVYRQVRPLDDLGMPESLHALVGARLDGLDAGLRELAQEASVLGQSFTLEGVSVVTGESAEALESQLRELVRRELLRYDSDARSPERGQFQFVQSVIREVAYGRIARSVRKDLHLKVARYYEQEAPVEAAVVIASHYTDAYRAGPDDELADRAREALARAARRALDLKSYAQALALIQQALDVPGSDGKQAALWELVPVAAGPLFRHEEAVAAARNAVHWYAEHGTEIDRVRSTHLLGTALIDADEPLEAAEAMSAVFDSDGTDAIEMMRLGAELSRALMRSDRMDEAADVALSVMMAAEANGEMAILIDAMNTRGTAITGLGRGAEGIALVREALRRAETASLPYETLRALNNVTVVDAVDGLYALAPLYRRGYELALRIRHGGLLVRLLSSYAYLALCEGDFEGAIEVLESADVGPESLWYGVGLARVETTRFVLTDDPVHLERARDLISPSLESHEPQYRSWAMDTECQFLWLEGRWEETFEQALRVPSVLAAEEFRHLAVMSAMMLGDPDRLRRAAEVIDIPLGRRFDTLRLAVDAGLEALEGDRSRAVGLFVQVIERMEEVEGPLAAATWRAVFASVLPDTSEAADAAAAAHEWFTSTRAEAYLRLFSDVWDGSTAARAEAG